MKVIWYINDKDNNYFGYSGNNDDVYIIDYGYRGI